MENTRRKMFGNLAPPDKFYGDTLSAFDPFAKNDEDHGDSDIHDISSFSSNYPGQSKKPKHGVFDNTAQKLEFEEFLENQEMMLFQKRKKRKESESRKRRRGRYEKEPGSSPKSTQDPNLLGVNMIQKNHTKMYNYKSSRRIIQVRKVRSSLNFSMKNKFMKDRADMKKKKQGKNEQ